MTYGEILKKLFTYNAIVTISIAFVLALKETFEKDNTISKRDSNPTKTLYIMLRTCMQGPIEFRLRHSSLSYPINVNVTK